MEEFRARETRSRDRSRKQRAIAAFPEAHTYISAPHWRQRRLSRDAKHWRCRISSKYSDASAIRLRDLPPPPPEIRASNYDECDAKSE